MDIIKKLLKDLPDKISKQLTTANNIKYQGGKRYEGKTFKDFTRGATS